MGKLFSKPKPPTMPKPVVLPAYTPPPEPEPEVPMPTVDDSAIEEKKKKEKMAQSQKSGRASTFLSDEEGGLG